LCLFALENKIVIVDLWEATMWKNGYFDYGEKIVEKRLALFSGWKGCHFRRETGAQRGVHWP
jgi:hypothetical protein